MRTFRALLKRNVKLFFKDKGLFFTSLITPLILLVLYATFLANVYRDSIVKSFSVELPEKILNGVVGGQLFSSLLAVSCVTVAFCSNMLMVQDKVSGARKDLLLTPVKRSTMALSYYLASLFSTLIICLTACVACVIYVACIGWYMSFADIMFVLLDVFLLVMFGTALSSIINYFLSSQGQISAVGSIVSSVYGFISGAYMPLSSFGAGLRNAIMFIPGTYGTSLLRNHALNGVLTEMANQNYPEDAITGLRNTLDCNLEFFGNQVSVPAMYIILSVTVVVLIGVYVLMNVLIKRKTK
jgi:multidrug/hemolysin transport system permease protein